GGREGVGGRFRGGEGPVGRVTVGAGGAAEWGRPRGVAVPAAGPGRRQQAHEPAAGQREAVAGLAPLPGWAPPRGSRPSGWLAPRSRPGRPQAGLPSGSLPPPAAWPSGSPPQWGAGPLRPRRGAGAPTP